MQILAKINGSTGPYFDVSITKTTIMDSNNNPVTKTDVRVKKTPVTEEIFKDYKHIQNFPYITDNAQTGDVYKVDETEEDFIFTSHTSYY